MKKIIIIGLVLLLSGCSTKFIYKNIDWLVYWYFDDYVELTDAQENILDDKINTWMSWHKQSEIPKYIAHLEELSTDIELQRLSLEKIDYHQLKSTAHWIRLKSHLIPDLVTLAPSLSQKQVMSMFDELEEKNKERAEEREERLSKTPEEQKKAFIKRNKKNLKRWLGQLTDEQEELITNLYNEYHSTSDLWLEYRQKYQTELKILLASQKQDDSFKVRLESMLMHPEVYRSERLNQLNLENGELYKQFLLAVYELSTEKQRSHLLEEISDFSEDFKDLAN